MGKRDAPFGVAAEDRFSFACASDRRHGEAGGPFDSSADEITPLVLVPCFAGVDGSRPGHAGNARRHAENDKGRDQVGRKQWRHLSGRSRFWNRRCSIDRFRTLNAKNHKPTSKATPEPPVPDEYFIYNCFAFVVGDETRFWWPGDEYSYWPHPDAPETVEAEPHGGLGPCRRSCRLALGAETGPGGGFQAGNPGRYGVQRDAAGRSRPQR